MNGYEGWFLPWSKTVMTDISSWVSNYQEPESRNSIPEEKNPYSNHIFSPLPLIASLTQSVISAAIDRSLLRWICFLPVYYLKYTADNMFTFDETARNLSPLVSFCFRRHLLKENNFVRHRRDFKYSSKTRGKKKALPWTNAKTTNHGSYFYPKIDSCKKKKKKKKNIVRL